MARPLRFLQGDKGKVLVEVTTRTLQGRLLLRPSAELNRRLVGIIGRALELHSGVEVHAIAHASTHYHLLLTVPSSCVLASFMCFVNGNLACEAARLHNWSEKFWGRRYRSIEILDEHASVRRLRYMLAHGVKEGLVEACLDWPGVNSARALLNREPLRGIWYDRTLAYESKRRDLEPEAEELAVPYEVHLAPLPAWRDLTDEKRHDNFVEMVADIEHEAAVGRSGSVAGAVRVAAADPQHRPSHIARSPAPPCHTTSPELRNRFCDAYRAFVQAFRDAAHARPGRGRRKRAPSFPPGCFPPAGAFIVRLARLPALAAAPAPT